MRLSSPKTTGTYSNNNNEFFSFGFTRWVDEMREIAKTFEVDGGFHQETESPFRAIAEIYQLVAHGTELGKEVIGNRQRGQTAEDVAVLVEEGTKKRKG